MVVWAWTVLPLAVLHGWAWRRSRDLLRFQILLDLILAAVVGPALVLGADLNPVRCLSRNRPFSSWEFSDSTRFQPTHSDLVLQLHPWMAEARRDLLEGRLPLISDRIGGGLPLLANGQSGLWAPVNLPVWVLGPERGTTIMAFWKLELAGLGAFLLLRRGRRLRWAAAAVGSLAALRGRHRVGRTIAAGAALGWLLGCGLNPETAAIVVGSAVLAGAVLHPGRWRRLVVMLMVAAPVTLALAWPTLSYIVESQKFWDLRVHKPNLERPETMMRINAVQQLVVPMAHGHPGRGDWRAPYPQAAVATSVGGLALGLLVVGRTRRRHRRWVWATAANLAFAAVVVYRLPPLDALLVRLPPISSMTLPRFAVLLTWGLALLSAFAIDGAIGGRRRIWAWPAAATAAVVVAAVMSSPWRLATIDCLLIGLTVLAFAAASKLVDRPGWLAPLVAVELALYGLGINPTASPSDRLPRPQLVKRLVALQEAAGGRVLGLGGVFPANLASRYGLVDLRSYDPLRPRPYVRMMVALGDENPVLGGALRRTPAGLSGAWSVRFLVTPPAAEATGWERVWSDDSGAIWRNPRWLPELRIAGRVVEAGGDEGWRILMEDGIDFATEAVVRDSGIDIAASDRELVDFDLGASRILATVRCDGPCLLVVARPWAPGWRAQVDGESCGVVRANLAGLGVAVPAGQHDVELSYNPWRW